MTQNPTLDRLIKAALAFQWAKWDMAKLSLYDRRPYKATYEKLCATRQELESVALGLDMEDSDGNNKRTP